VRKASSAKLVSGVAPRSGRADRSVIVTCCRPMPWCFQAGPQRSRRESSVEPGQAIPPACAASSGQCQFLARGSADACVDRSTFATASSTAVAGGRVDGDDDAGEDLDPPPALEEEVSRIYGPRHRWVSFTLFFYLGCPWAIWSSP